MSLRDKMEELVWEVSDKGWEEETAIGTSVIFAYCDLDNRLNNNSRRVNKQWGETVVCENWGYRLNNFSSFYF